MDESLYMCAIVASFIGAVIALITLLVLKLEGLLNGKPGERTRKIATVLIITLVATAILYVMCIVGARILSTYNGCGWGENP